MTEEFNHEQFGRELRRRRETLGMTLEQLAERSSLTPNYIGSIELGRRDPSLSTVVALAKGFGVPVGELLGTVMDLNPSTAEMGRLFDEADETIQDAVLMILRQVTTKKRRGTGARLRMEDISYER